VFGKSFAAELGADATAAQHDDPRAHGEQIAQV
jgi:hypothetical protein